MIHGFTWHDKAVEKSAADGFRLNTAHATLDEPAAERATAVLERAGVLAFAKSLKPTHAPLATIEIAAAWTFAANGTRAAVRLIDGTYPDVRSIVGSGDEPVLFAVNPQHFRETLDRTPQPCAAPNFRRAPGSSLGRRCLRTGRRK